MIAPTLLPGLVAETQPIDDLVVKVNETFLLLSDAAKQKLMAFFRLHDAWDAASQNRPTTFIPPGMSPRAIMAGCEFCPSEGGRCIVCQNCKSRDETGGIIG